MGNLRNDERNILTRVTCLVVVLLPVLLADGRVAPAAAADEGAGAASAAAHAARCSELRSQGNLTLALFHCTRAIASGCLAGDDLAATLNLRGGIYLQEGAYGRATDDFSKAIILRPRDAAAFSRRAMAYRRQGETARAIADTERALELSGPAEVRRVQAYLRSRGHYAGALDGAYGPATRAALQACILRPDC